MVLLCLTPHISIGGINDQSERQSVLLRICLLQAFSSTLCFLSDVAGKVRKMEVHLALIILLMIT